MKSGILKKNQDTADTTQRDAIQPAGFVDRRPSAAAQRKLVEMATTSNRGMQLRAVRAGIAREAQHSGEGKATEQAKSTDAPDSGSPVQAMDNPGAQARTVGEDATQSTPPFVPKANNTGLPVHLKAGIESLSGMSLDHVRVHYNSSRPVQLNAHAYAQGSEIHLATGQEKHLPHEAWHIVQQAKGRVAPTLQLKDGIALNDDEKLEHEADIMGAKALEPTQPVQLVKQGSPPLRAHNTGLSMPLLSGAGVLQKTPDQALDKARNDKAGEIKRKSWNRLLMGLKRRLDIARRIARFPTVTSKIDSYHAVQYRLRERLRLLSKILDRNIWNEGLRKNSMEYWPITISRAEKGFRHKRPKGRRTPGKSTQEWFLNKRNAEKSMNPTRKMAGLVSALGEGLTPDIWLALKMFFAHTASFVPAGGLGRDFRSLEHGTYYRSSNDVIRDGASAFFKENAEQYYQGKNDERPGGKKSPTYQVINKSFLDAIKESGKVNSNISDMSFFEKDSDPDFRYAEYLSGAGSHTGALGLIQNAYRTMDVAGRLDKPRGKPQEPMLVGESLTPVVEDSLLTPGSGTNYHDTLLADRSRLIHEVAESIRTAYGKTGPGIKIIPIQSEDHASLILEMNASPEDAPEERAWRELFIEKFNAAAIAQERQTRISHRGSFGFLHPSASSVGRPVRIWPGLVPAEVFKRLIFSTLNDLALKPQGDFVFHNPAIDVEKESTALFPPGKTALHLDTLKVAVRYAQQIMRETMQVQAPPKLLEWVAVRLQNNLQKARFILGAEQGSSMAAQENSYLKSALVIENLMEYSYFLEAMRLATDEARHDPYPDYLRKKIGTEKHHQTTHTFYLDSGMQAIVCAHLLARNWIVSQQKMEPHTALNTIDLYSYFEYAMVDKINLHLDAKNRGKTGFSDLATFKAMVKKTFNSTPPAIIAADLNPVFTAAGQNEQRVPYAQVFEHFSEKGNTVPILDVTNASLDKVRALDLGAGYPNYIVLESLSKHQQLGADKFTMGRLSAVGSEEFINFSKKLLDPIAKEAYQRLPAAYRLRMDRLFYGNDARDQATFARDFLGRARRYDGFMKSMGTGDAWLELTLVGTDPDKDSEQLKRAHLADALLQKTLGIYAEEVRKSGNSKLPLEAAFQALPTQEQNFLLRRLQSTFSATGTQKGSFSGSDWSQTPVPLHGLASQTGIANAGNTCYLAAALNMIAFSPYQSMFNAVDIDDVRKAGLREEIRLILVEIQADRPVTLNVVKRLLTGLSNNNLLEAPIAQGVRRSLNAQRDPTEFMEYLSNYFGRPQNNLLLSQHYQTTLNMQTAAPLTVAPDPTRHSNVNANGEFISPVQDEWVIKLPISRVNDLAGAIRNYERLEQLDQITASYGGQVWRGPGTRKIVFGNETPAAIVFQLMRWNGAGGKDMRPIDMPQQLHLRIGVYRLTTVIYHLGDDPEGGHYTTSTRHNEQWKYRDDLNVSDDLNIEERKKGGYLYTYIREGDV